MRLHWIGNKQRDRKYKEEPNGNSGIEKYKWNEKFTSAAQ